VCEKFTHLSKINTPKEILDVRIYDVGHLPETDLSEQVAEGLVNCLALPVPIREIFEYLLINAFYQCPYTALQYFVPNCGNTQRALAMLVFRNISALPKNLTTHRLKMLPHTIKSLINNRLKKV